MNLQLDPFFSKFRRILVSPLQLLNLLSSSPASFPFFPFVFSVSFLSELLVRCCGVGEGVSWHNHRAQLKEADWHHLDLCQSSSGEIPTAEVGECVREIDWKERKRERHYGKVKGGGWKLVVREKTRCRGAELLRMLVVLACYWPASLFSVCFMIFHSIGGSDCGFVRCQNGTKEGKTKNAYLHISSALICCTSPDFIPLSIVVFITHSYLHFFSISHLLYLEIVYFIAYPGWQKLEMA